jgi:dephospho-CoA kinase
MIAAHCRSRLYDYNGAVSNIIGLTGGIGAGKSTVASLLVDRGAVIIDADRVAHDVYLPGTEGHDALVERFGQEIIGPDGHIDRRLLGAQVFGDEQALADLNAIIHPLVRQAVAARLLELTEDSPDAVVVIEAALMTETGWAGGSGTLWVVIAEPDIAMARLVRDRGMDPHDAKLRMAAQTSNEERKKFADILIENNGSLLDLEAEVERAWRAYLAPAS